MSKNIASLGQWSITYGIESIVKIKTHMLYSMYTIRKMNELIFIKIQQIPYKIKRQDVIFLIYFK